MQLKREVRMNIIMGILPLSRSDLSYLDEQEKGYLPMLLAHTFLDTGLCSYIFYFEGISS